MRKLRQKNWNLKKKMIADAFQGNGSSFSPYHFQTLFLSVKCVTVDKLI